MKIGYTRVSKPNGSQSLNLQIDALLEAGVSKENIYHEKVSGIKEERPELAQCIKALRSGDILVVWKLDRLGRSLRHLINIVENLTSKGVGLRILTGKGASIDTATASGKLMFGIFATFAEFERELIRERTIAGLESARARGKKGGRRFQLTKAKVRLAEIAMKNRETKISDLCKELGGITKQTLYRYVSPTGTLRSHGKTVLSQKHKD